MVEPRRPDLRHFMKFNTHTYRLVKNMPERAGHGCRVICRGKGRGPRNVLIEFADGFRMVTHWRAIKKNK